MNNAIYAATTGMINQARTLDVAASNIANAETAGYKRDQLITSSFSERVAYRLDSRSAEIGAHTHGAIASELVTDYTQGRLESTGRALDFAILGEGYFSVEAPDGEAAVTRDGHFEVDAEGFLRTASGGYVLGEGGRIEVGMGQVTVDQLGQIMSDGQQIDRLAIIVPGEEAAGYAKRAGNILEPPDGGNAFTGRIAQGQLERSNVDSIHEMSQMMAASRAFQSCAQALKAIDQINQKSVNEIGRV